MENLFLEKNFVQKLIIAVIVIVLFNFSAPTIANAKSFIGKSLEKIGGELLPPVMKLFVTVADAILNALQTNLMDDVKIVVGANSGELKDKSGFLKNLLKGTLWVAGGAALVTITILTGGLGAIPILSTAMVTGAVVSFVMAGKTVISAISNFKGEFDIVQIEYTPFAIFSNKVPMFDINFFNPKTINSKITPVKEQLENYKESTEVEKEIEEIVRVDTANDILNRGACIADWSTRIMYTYPYDDMPVDTVEGISLVELPTSPEAKENIDIIGRWLENGLLVTSKYNNNLENYKKTYYKDCFNMNSGWVEKLIQLAWISYTDCGNYPEANGHTDGTEIEYIMRFVYSGEIFWVSTGMESTVLSDYPSYAAVTTSGINTLGYALEQYGVDKYKEEILKMYNNTLSIVYGNKEQQAEEQEKAEIEAGAKDYANQTPAKILQKTIANWYTTLRDLALVVLLIILVYIGIRIVISSTAPEKAKYKQMITNWVVAICILFLLHLIMIATLAVTETITDGLTGNCVDVVIVPLPQEINKIDGDKFSFNEVDENGDPIPLMLNTNFVGYIRYLIGIYYNTDGEAFTCVGYMIMYIMLVVQTCMFTWVYGKRVVYMAFLTIIAPLVAITYPIDKIGDGKSQAFDMWLKEYIFNALLQPIHLLIYTLVCGTAMDLMIATPIYGIIALGFVVPAEKFIRKMFGFEKAQTPSALGGAAGAALAMTGIQKIGNMIRPEGKDDRDAEKQPKSHRIRQANIDEQKGHDNNLIKGREKTLNSGSGSVRQSNNTDGNSENNNDNTTPPVRTDTGEESANNNTEGQPVESGGTLLETGTEGSSENDTGNAIPETGTEGSSGNDTGDATPESGTDVNSTNSNNTETQPNSNNIDLRQAATDQANSQAQKRVSSDKEKTGKRFKRAVGKMWDMDRARLANTFTYKKSVRRHRKIARAVGGGAFGAGAALTMAAMKMAMGANAGDVVNTAIAGGTAGYAIGSKATQKAQEFAKGYEHVENASSGWRTTEENKKRINKKAIREWKNNEDNRDVFREAGDIGGYDWKELMNSDFTEQCLRFGLQDPEDIVAAYDYMNSEDFQKTYGLTEDEGGNLTEQERRSLAIQAAKDAHVYGDIRHDQKKLDEMRSRKQHLFSEDKNIKEQAQAAHDAQAANRRNAQANYNRAQEAYKAKVSEAEAQASETSTNENDRDLFKANKDIKDAQEELEREQKRQQQMSEDQVAKNEEAKRRIAQLQEEIAKEANEHEGSREAFNALVAEAEANDPEIKRLREEIASKDTEIQEAKTRRAAKSEIDVIRAQKREMERQYKQRNSALADEENALRKVESELEAKRRQVKRLEKTPAKISKDQKARNDAEITRLKDVIKEKEDAKQSLLQGRFSQEYDIVKATKKAVSDAKVQSVEELHKAFVDTMVDQSMKQYFDVYTQKDKYTN